MTETVLSLAGNSLEVTHAAGTGGAATLSLDTPVVLTTSGGRVRALRADTALNVVRVAATAGAESVSLHGALTERLGTLGLKRERTTRTEL